MKIIIKSDEINLTIPVPLTVLKVGALQRIMPSKLFKVGEQEDTAGQDSIDLRILSEFYTVLRDWKKQHPKFVLADIQSDDTHVKIVL